MQCVVNIRNNNRKNRINHTLRMQLIVEYPKVLSISPRKVLKKTRKGLPPLQENQIYQPSETEGGSGRAITMVNYYISTSNENGIVGWGVVFPWPPTKSIAMQQRSNGSNRGTTSGIMLGL
jgi:hypothetical protein